MQYDNVEFSLKDKFLDSYKKKKVNFGPLGLFVFSRTYSRPLENGKFEKWWQTVKRVVEGCYLIQKRHCKWWSLPWNERQAQKSAQEMYEAIFTFKFLPPGRGLWAMGTDFMFKNGGTCLNNCAFVSTADIAYDFSGPFSWLMEMSMLGVGVGFDTEGAFGKEVFLKPPRLSKGETYNIEDSRQGWTQCFKRLLDAYSGKDSIPEFFNYDQIRPAGSIINGFGGIAPGADPLIKLVERATRICDEYVKEDKPVDSRLIVDLMNFAGAAVVAGGVRRSAELSLGRADDFEYIRLKEQDNINDPNLSRWASNNSLFATVGMDYSELAKLSSDNGEPGYFWLENARKYGRLKDGEKNRDRRVAGINPCQPGWAVVLTPEGIRQLDQIKIGSTIWSGKRWTKVINKWSTGKKKVYKYHTTSGMFVGTENHRIFEKGKRIEIKNAKFLDLSTGPKEKTIHFPGYIMDGLVIGDGSVHKASRDKVILYVGEKDQDYLNSEISHLFIKYRPGISKTAWTITTSIIPSELVKSYIRSIPDRFYYGNSDEKAAFLRGLFSANGSVIRDRVTLKQSSLEMIYQVRDMLSSLGIRSYVTKNEPVSIKHKNGIYISKTSYNLNICTDKSLFAEKIGFIQIYKTEKLNLIISNKKTKGKNSFEIKNIEDCGIHEVFDLTVEDNEHSYWTHGILVSNCGEQTLESYELCCLVETFPSLHSSLDEYKKTLKYAYLYGKTVTLLPTHDPRTNAVMFRNRRIGLSQTGIVEAINKVGFREHMRWCDEGYSEVRNWDEIYSDWLCIPRSIKVTTVKPSGSVSLLPGVTPGVHFPHSEYYVRRVRVSKTSDIWKHYKKSGYKVEDDVYADNTVVIEFLVKENNFIKGKDFVGIWEQLQLAAALQKEWSDNAVSITVTVKPEETKDLATALSMYETQLKTVSFLPLRGDEVYKQAPYEKISKEEYEKRISKLKPIDFDQMIDIDKKQEKFCDGDVCMIV